MHSDLFQNGSKFSHQVTSLALLGFKVGLQVVSLALPNSLGLPYWHYQLVLSWYLHQPESHKLSLNKVSQSVSYCHPDPKIGPQVYMGPIKMGKVWPLINPLILPRNKTKLILPDVSRPDHTTFFLLLGYTHIHMGGL